MNRAALRKFLTGMLGLATSAALAPTAHAAQPTPPVSTGCGIIGTTTASSSVYDPFSPTGLTVTNVSLNLQRVNGGGGEKTDIVNFYLTDDTGRSDGVQAIPRSAAVAGQVVGLGTDIFYDKAETKPIVSPTSLDPSTGNWFLKIIFTGNNKDSDTAIVNFDVIVPKETSLAANNGNLTFMAKFGCSTTGGGQQTQQTGQIANAIAFPVLVKSALRATYTGAALDFGEIGDVDNAAAPNRKTPDQSYIRVESSGPYSVEWSSANSYRLLNQGFTLGNASTAELINYKLGFMGVSRSHTASSTASVTCVSAGLNSFVDELHMQATLEEGGKGKTPSGTKIYSDEITVTITPLVYNAPTTLDCSAIALPSS